MSKKRSKNSEITGNLDPKYWVQKSDPLVLMRSVPFSLGELKILDTYISRINASDDARCTVIFTKEEYEDLMGLTCANYRALEKHTKGMLGKVVELEMPNEEYLQFVLFEQARYRKDEYGKPIVELTCTQTAKDLFFCIGKYHYFKYALENVIKLTRKSSYLLYIYIMHERYRSSWDIDLEDLRDVVLDCKGQESYHAFKEFKRAVLDPAVKEVNQKTDCHFSYEAVKRGRRVVKIKFIYISKSQLEGQMSFDDLPNMSLPIEQREYEEEDLLRTYGSERIMLLAEGCGYEFNKEQMEQIERILVRIHIPKDAATNDLTFGRQFYLKEKYAILNTVTAQKAKNGEKPIKDRFRYFVKMLEDDAFQPAAYKGE